MLKRLATFVIALALIGLITGCGSDSSTTSDSDISEDFGGFMPSAEAPAFGDETIAAEMTDDEDYDDPMLTNAIVETQLEEPETEIYALRIVWGMLRYDSTMTTPTDWSGLLSVSRGSIILRKVIKFEPATDWIVIRDSRDSLKWVSQTTVHHDGIFVNLVIPPADDTEESDEPVTVTFDTEPFEITFNLEDLNVLDTIYYLEDSNAVAFHAFNVVRIPCPKGFFSGVWGKDEEGNGLFYGKWMSRFGGAEGHFEGTWGSDQDTNPDNVFYGKVIDLEGNFLALLRGTYHYRHPMSHRGNSSGWLRGYYHDEDGNIMGVMKGHYHEQPKNSGFGFMQGRWREYCNENYAGAIEDGMDD